MKHISILSLTLASLTVLSLEAASPAPNPATSTSSKSSAVSPQRAERGKYLVSIMGCHDCHTPWVVGPNGPEPDMTRMLSGHPQALKMPAPVSQGDGPWVWQGAGTNTAFAGPWGISYTANLTPDQLTGMGIWTEEMFVKAIRTGKHFGVSRPILPPMPWTVYRNATDEDLKSIYAYLRTIPPVKNLVPDPEPPKPAAPQIAEKKVAGKQPARTSGR